ncbi:12606_t:CDS:2 [Ambispora gerdemannii]|uniref:12606_t:CDS:1 n=1 Tax=Ambispora gerdemannii TaxID=144530 RepID=A0A9N9A7D7_9GLOM|nr:12606_t:CDS:2 [Ambispora gerdemannii]
MKSKNNSCYDNDTGGGNNNGCGGGNGKNNNVTFSAEYNLPAQQTVQKTTGTECNDNGSNSQTKIQNKVPIKTNTNPIVSIKYLISTLQTSSQHPLQPLWMILP